MGTIIWPQAAVWHWRTSKAAASWDSSLPDCATAALNAANEVLVARFLDHEIPFLAIGEGLKRCLEANQAADFDDLEGLSVVDRSTRDWAIHWVP